MSCLARSVMARSVVGAISSKVRATRACCVVLAVTKNSTVLRESAKRSAGRSALTVFPMPVGVRVGGEMRRVEMPNVGERRIEVGDAEMEIDPGGWLLVEGA